MFARIIPIKNGMVKIRDDTIPLSDFLSQEKNAEVGEDEKGHKYVVIIKE